MNLLHTVIARFRSDDEGQGLAEYALILALIAIVAIIALIFLGGQVSSILSTVGDLGLATSTGRRALDGPGVHDSDVGGPRKPRGCGRGDAPRSARKP